MMWDALIPHLHPHIINLVISYIYSIFIYIHCVVVSLGDYRSHLLKFAAYNYRIYIGKFQGFELQNFRGLVILKFFVNKLSRMAIKSRSGHVHTFKFSRLQEKSMKTYESECFIT